MVPEARPCGVSTWQCVLLEGLSARHSPRSWGLVWNHLLLLHVYLCGEPLIKAPPCSQCTLDRVMQAPADFGASCSCWP